MKHRDGFVSNSSSSSFLILGVELSSDHKMYRDFLKNFGSGDDDWDCESWEKLPNGINYLNNEDTTLFGHIISSGSEYEFPAAELSLIDVIEKASDVATKLEIPIKDVKLICGVRAC